MLDKIAGAEVNALVGVSVETSGPTANPAGAAGRLVRPDGAIARPLACPAMPETRHSSIATASASVRVGDASRRRTDTAVRERMVFTLRFAGRAEPGPNRLVFLFCHGILTGVMGRRR